MIVVVVALALVIDSILQVELAGLFSKMGKIPCVSG